MSVNSEKFLEMVDFLGGKLAAEVVRQAAEVDREARLSSMKFKFANGGWQCHYCGGTQPDNRTSCSQCGGDRR